MPIVVGSGKPRWTAESQRAAHDTPRMLVRGISCLTIWWRRRSGGGLCWRATRWGITGGNSSRGRDGSLTTRTSVRPILQATQ